jgi:hypothetical protein
MGARNVNPAPTIPRDFDAVTMEICLIVQIMWHPEKQVLKPPRPGPTEIDVVTSRLLDSMDLS